MTEANDAETPSGGGQTKVARLLVAYGLEDLGAQLEERWTADGEERMSLRALATLFNQRLLEAAMTKAEIQSLPGEVENVYELLTGSEVSEADRTRTVRRLEREGVDVDALLDDFVTYQAIRSYLKRERNAEYVDDDRDRTVVESENVQRLRGRLSAVTEAKLEQLRSNGDIVLGESRLLVDVNVLCETCGQQYDVETLLDRGGCDCDDSRGLAE